MLDDWEYSQFFLGRNARKFWLMKHVYQVGLQISEESWEGLLFGWSTLEFSSLFLEEILDSLSLGENWLQGWVILVISQELDCGSTERFWFVDGSFVVVKP